MLSHRSHALTFAFCCCAAGGRPSGAQGPEAFTGLGAVQSVKLTAGGRDGLLPAHHTAQETLFGERTEPEALNPKPETRNPKRRTRNPALTTLYPKS